MNYKCKRYEKQKIPVLKLCLSGMLGALEYVIFSSFSFILYVEFITFTVVMLAIYLEKDVAVLSSITFGMANMLLSGFSLWSFLYLIVYTSYTLILSSIKKIVIRKKIYGVLFCGFLSFLTGQLLQIPFILFSKRLTVMYLIAGLKTSLIQGVFAGFTYYMLSDSLKVALMWMKKRIRK